MLVRVVVKVEQGEHLGVHHERHVPAGAAVAPVRAAQRLELLPVHGRATVPTVAGGGMQHDAVHKRRHDLTSVHWGAKLARWLVRGTHTECAGTRKRRARTRTRPRTTRPVLAAHDWASHDWASRGRHDADDLAATASAELDVTRAECEQRVVTAAPDLVARVELGAALPHQDLAGVDQLPAVALDPEPLRGRVAAVPRAGRALLV